MQYLHHLLLKPAHAQVEQKSWRLEKSVNQSSEGWNDHELAEGPSDSVSLGKEEG